MKRYNIILLEYVMVLGVCAQLLSCKKFLDEKPNQSIVTITTIRDCQALLDNYGPTTSLSVAGADEYYLPEGYWQSLDKFNRDTYIWEPNAESLGWNQPYESISRFNNVLVALEAITASAQEKNYIKGQALVHRAFTFYQLAQLYCAPYSTSASADLGLPLRLLPDIELRSVRSTVEETYDQITNDLKTAAEILPAQKTASNRPNKISTYGILSRVYLSMRDYENAEKYADLYLTSMSALMDFNTLDIFADPAISYDNVETAYYDLVQESLPDYVSAVDTSLLSLYEPNDLRRPVYFADNGDGTFRFKGSYEGTVGNVPFGSIATDEIYLIRAECLARRGATADAVADVNTLLITRWQSGTFVPRSASNKEEALEMVLTERRKELVYRTTRWTDLRRLNLEGRNISLKRVIDGTAYTLPANDKRWIWLIPQDVIMRSGMKQNER